MWTERRMFRCQVKWHVSLHLGFIQLAQSVALFGIFLLLKFDISAKPAEAQPVEVLGDKGTMYTGVTLY